jgi:hypothetical protein
MASLVLALVIPACSSGGDDGSAPATESGASSTTRPGSGSTSSSTSLPPVPTPTLAWENCGENLDCATLIAPLDYRRPTETAGQVKLPVVRHRALSSKKRIGSLIVNPGGPGFGGTYLARGARSLYGADILQAFDIIGFDPRGTGGATPAVDCISEYDPYFGTDTGDSSPAGVAESIALADEFAQACSTRTGESLGFVATEDTARDMDLLRRALGEETISYFGFSYGSELGAVWVTLFPDTVRAAVFDGAGDPDADMVQASLDQAKGFEIALNSFLDHCRTKCGFSANTDPGAKFDDIMREIAESTYPTADGRPVLNRSIAYTAVLHSLYSTRLWPKLDSALSAADSGDGRPMLELYDDYYQRQPDGTYANDIEAFIAITCLDSVRPQNAEVVTASADEILAAAPRVGWAFLDNYTCLPWPVPARAPIQVVGTDRVAVMVVGTTNDPATSLESTRRMASALARSVFVTVAGDGHTGYLQSECAREIVGDYLVDLEIPKRDVTCD